MPRERAAAAVAGVESPQRRRVLAHLKRAGVCTLDEIAAAMELSRTAAKAHLARLEAQGVIERARVEADRPGRPPLAYRVTGKGDELFPTSDDALLTELLDYLRAEGHAELLDTFFAQLWRRRRAEYRQALRVRRTSPAAATTRVRLRVLGETLERHHFMPQITTRTEPGWRHVTVEVAHCPFPAAVRSTRTPCAQEARFLGEVLGRSPVAVAYMSEQQRTCSFAFRLPVDD